MQTENLTRYDLLEIKENRFGKGVYALQPIKTGECIAHLTGQQLTHAESIKDEDINNHAIQIRKDLYINTDPPVRFINHSCNPNTGISSDTFLITIHPIEAGEELFLDYSTTIEDGWNMTCACGHHMCRKFIGNFSSLPPDVQQFYLEKQIVMSFIARQFKFSLAHTKPLD